MRWVWIVGLSACLAPNVDGNRCFEAAAHLEACTDREIEVDASCSAADAEQILSASCSDLTGEDKGLRDALGWDVHHEAECNGMTLRYITSAMDEAQALTVGAKLCATVVALEGALDRIRQARLGDARERDLMRLWFSSDELQYSELNVDAIEKVVQDSLTALKERETAFSAISKNWWDRLSILSHPCGDNTVAVHAGGDRIGLCPAAWESDDDNWIHVLVHEATHAFGDTDDHGYMGPCGYGEPSDLRRITRLTPEQLLRNADTYAGWVSNRPFFILDPIPRDGQTAPTCQSRR